jgi:hypothetical protein
MGTSHVSCTAAAAGRRSLQYRPSRRYAWDDASAHSRNGAIQLVLQTPTLTRQRASMLGATPPAQVIAGFSRQYNSDLQPKTPAETVPVSPRWRHTHGSCLVRIGNWQC